jgi:hypothetical protein
MAKAALDLEAHLLVQGSAPKRPTRSPLDVGIDPLPLELVRQIEQVRRRHHDDVRLEVGDQLHLLLGLAAGHRDHRAAQTLGAVVGAETAGEQAVTVADMHHVAASAAGGVDRARHQRRPHVDIVLRVADNRRLSGRARRCMHAHDLVARHGKHLERVVLAQVVLGRERKLAQIVKRFQIVGVCAVGIELLPVVLDVLIRVTQRPAQAIELQGRNLVAAGGFNRFVGVIVGIDTASCDHLADLPTWQKSKP